MQFYRCETKPLTLARTQADAKGTGAAFKSIDVDTSHKGLTAFFAQLIAEVAGSRQPSAPEPEVADDHPPHEPSPAPETIERIVYRDAPGKGPPAVIVEIMNATACEEFIWSAEADRLDKLEAIIAERRAELAKAEPVAPAPRQRVRKAA